MDKGIVLTTQENLRDLITQTVAETLKDFFSKAAKEPDNLMLTRKEVAKMLGISLPTLGQLTKEGVIKAVRIGKSVRYYGDDVNNALKAVQSIKYMRGRIINNVQV